jgi:hypothetical protein
MTNTESTDKQQHTHIQDQISEKEDDNFNEELDEGIHISFFPSNFFYKMLGVDFILTKHKLNPDPIMLPLYQKFAEDILEPQEAFDLKKDEIENDLQFELEPH